MPKKVHDGIRKRCDCARRKWAKCTHPWHFSFHHGGHEHRYSLDKIARARNEPVPTGKTEAAKWRDRLRDEIRKGTFVDPDAPTPIAPGDTRLTLADVVRDYRKKYVDVPTRRAGAKALFDLHLDMLVRAQVPAAAGTTVTLGDKAIEDISKADVEAVRDERRAALKGKKLAKGGECGINRLLSRARHLFSWAVAEGYAPGTPFKRGGVTVVKRNQEAEGARDRRLLLGVPERPEHEAEAVLGEEERLLKYADPHLRALIVAALTTGCRIGELLSLRWAQVRFDDKGTARALELSARRTKTNKARVIPVGHRLRAELVMRRDGPDGKRLPPTAFVFGNEVGEPVKDVRRQWERTCKAAKITGLHFHDLRRELASRLLESKTDLHDVRDFLGHANISTTSTYLASTPVRLAAALDRLDPEPPTPETETDSHTVRTNAIEDASGRSDRPATMH